MYFSVPEIFLLELSLKADESTLHAVEIYGKLNSESLNA